MALLAGSECHTLPDNPSLREWQRFIETQNSKEARAKNPEAAEIAAKTYAAKPASTIPPDQAHLLAAFG